LSDIRDELDAARDAGMQTIQLVRDGALDPQAPHRQVRSFDEIATI
jgi:enolase-phosphatase E1